MPKKNDNIVGRSEGPIVAGGHQTPEQAAIVQQGEGGKSDAERNAGWTGEGSRKNPPDPAIGGSSGGHSDQIAARGPKEDQKIADGLYDTEKTHGGNRRS